MRVTPGLDGHVCVRSHGWCNVSRVSAASVRLLAASHRSRRASARRPPARPSSILTSHPYISRETYRAFISPQKSFYFQCQVCHIKLTKISRVVAMAAGQESDKGASQSAAMGACLLESLILISSAGAAQCALCF